MQKKAVKRICILPIMLCLCISFSAYGQTRNQLPLTSVMQQLEQTYGLRFSFVPEELEGITVSLPPQEKDLKLILKLLNTQTSFTFTLLENRYVTVVYQPENTYCGNLIAWDTGEALPGATILVSEKEASTVSNAAGYFYIHRSVPQKAQVTISYLGYFSVRLPLQAFQENCLTIKLFPKSSALDEVVVKTFLVKGISKQTNGAIRLSSNGFGLLPGQIENDVLQIAQALPGVESVDETISNINIRGGANFETLMLWDHIRLYQSGHFFGLISAFNPQLTNRVTIFKNGTPPRYGQAISGVIAMESNDKVAQDFSGGIGVDLIDGSVFLSIPLAENASVQVSGRHSLSFLQTPVYTNYSARMFQNTEITQVKDPRNVATIHSEVDFSFFDFNTKFLWDLSEKDAIRLHFMTIKNQLYFTESVENLGAKTSELQQQSAAGGLSWKRTWSPKIQTKALVYGSYYLLNALNKDVFTTQEQFQENEVLETGIKLDAHFVLSKKLELNLGYQFIETGVANTQEVSLPQFLDYTKEVLRTHSLFSNLKYTSTSEQTVLEVGVRASKYTKFKTPSLEPRLSFYQKLGGGFSVQLLGELMSQSITQRIDYESDFLGIKKRRWALANPESVPLLKSKQVSLGGNYNKNGWYLGLDGFYKTVEGITATSQAFQNQFQFTDATGAYTAKGLEVVLNKRISHFSTWFSYLYMQNDYTFADFVPTQFPNNIDIRHTASLAGTYTYKDFKLSLGVNWHSGKPYTIPVVGNEIVEKNGQKTLNFGKPNDARIPDYFRVDFSAEYLWAFSPEWTAKINVGILNLLDKKNTLNRYYTLGTDGNGSTFVNQIEKKSLGFTPNVSLRVLF